MSKPRCADCGEPTHCSWVHPNGHTECSKKENEVIENKERRLREILGVKFGQVSMCWTRIPTGDFDATKAGDLLEEAVRLIGDLDE